MSLEVNLSEEKNVIKQPAETLALSGAVKIDRIVDFPQLRKVIAFVDDIGGIPLENISDDNYDTPAEWTNADVVAGVEAWINANSSS